MLPCLNKAAYTREKVHVVIIAVLYFLTSTRFLYTIPFSTSQQHGTNMEGEEKDFWWFGLVIYQKIYSQLVLVKLLNG